MINKKSLKYPKPRRRSNSRINSTKTQHHLHDLTMTSSEPTFNKTKWGDISKLTHTNYDEWRDNMIPVLSAMRAYAIVAGDDPEPQLLDLDHDDIYDDWKAKEAEATSIITLPCSHEVRHSVKGIRNPHEMWNVLETSLDTAGSYIGRQDILCQFRARRLRRTNHSNHTSPSSVSTAYSWTIQTTQLPIAISARKYSHHCHHSMRWY